MQAELDREKTNRTERLKHRASQRIDFLEKFIIPILLGTLGSVIYLEAEEAGIRATGIGCYCDDPVHAAFGIVSREWQSFYHFTVGGPVEDGRLSTLPAYNFEEA